MGKVLLITGASRGIGAETARLAASSGYSVGVGYAASATEARNVVESIVNAGGSAIPIAADVSDDTQVERMFSEVDRHLGPVTGLVNSAGIIGSQRRTDELQRAEAEQVLSVNVVGTMLCCGAAVRRMSTHHGGGGGAIVNVSSIAAVTGGRTRSLYAASKGAIDSFTRGLAKEVAREGIRVNAIRPGMVKTEMNAAVWTDPQKFGDVTSTIPMNRFGTTGEIAAAILWLLSDEASFVTAALLDVAGGGLEQRINRG